MNNNYSRGRKSILNSTSGFFKTLLVSIAGLVATKIYIKYFGSDFNGVMTTSTQLMSALMVLEGGFTIASNVALYKPFEKRDFNTVNAILSATKKRFELMSVLTMSVGIFAAILYGCLIKSSVHRLVIISIFVFTVFSVTANFYISMKYRVIILTDQKEYVISNITTITTLLGYILIIIASIVLKKTWLIGAIVFLYSLSCYWGIAIYAKIHYKYINFNVKPNYKLISGSGDIFVQKVTSVLYSSMPTIAISFVSTTMASVYGVYNMVFNVAKNVLSVFSQAPRLSFGSLLAEEKKNMEKIKNYTFIYEMIVLIMTSVCVVVVNTMIIPFLRLYLQGITDAEYINPIYAILFGATTFVGSIHIPAGQIILMSGNFKVSKKIQIIAAIILAILVPLLSYLFNITGTLIAVLIASVILAVAEISFVHLKFFKNDIWKIVTAIIATIVSTAVQTFIGYKFVTSCNSVISFISTSLLVAIISTGITVGLYFILFNKEMKNLIAMLLRLFKKRGG